MTPEISQLTFLSQAIDLAGGQLAINHRLPVFENFGDDVGQAGMADQPVEAMGIDADQRTGAEAQAVEGRGPR